MMLRPAYLCVILFVVSGMAIGDQSDDVIKMAIEDHIYGDISDPCLQCICKVEGCENEIEKCKFDVTSDACGPFQIHENYVDDCGLAGNDWRVCAKAMTCSTKCVQKYMHRYDTHCTRGQTPTCKDYARIHNGGPTGCRKQQSKKKEANLEAYWAKVKACCDKSGGC